MTYVAQRVRRAVHAAVDVNVNVGIRTEFQCALV